ncbi:MAG: FG-GAP-like repeat-containing protein [Candidatus Altiarchaeota archaeon]
MRILVVALILAAFVSCVSAEEYMSLYGNSSAKEVVFGLDVGDVNNDGRKEVAVAGSQDGLAYLFDYMGNLLWKRDMASIIYSVAVGDVNGDGVGEVIAGHTDMYVFDGYGNRLMRYNTQNPVHTIRTGDVNGDNVSDILLSAYDKSSCDKDSIIYAIDLNSKNELWKYMPDKSLAVLVGSYSVPYVIEAADLNGDNKSEVLAGFIYRSRSSGACKGMSNHPTAVTAVDGSGELIWYFETSGEVTSISTGDVDGDGKPDIAVGSYSTVYVLDAQGKLLWENSNVVTTGVEDVMIADVNGDGKGEVIVASNGVYVLDSTGKVLWSASTGSRTYAVASGDLDNDGLPEVIAGSGAIYVYSQDGIQLWQGPSHVSYEFIRVADLDGDGYNEVVTGSVRDVYIWKSTKYAKKLLAERLYNQAIGLGNTNITSALEKFTKAKTIYSELGDLNGRIRCMNEIDKLTKTSERIEEVKGNAGVFLDMARDFKNGGDYMNASKYAAMALYQSQELNASAREEAKAIISEANATMSNKATEELASANERYNAGDREGACIHATVARGYYEFLGDEWRVEKTGELISALDCVPESKPQENVTQESVTDMIKRDLSNLAVNINSVNPIYLIGLLAAVAAVMFMILVTAYFWMLSRRNTLDVNRLHKVSYGRDYESAVAQTGSQSKKYTVGEDRLVVGTIRTDEDHQVSPLKRRNMVVEKYTTTNGSGDVDMPKESEEIVKAPPRIKVPKVERYRTSGEETQVEEDRKRETKLPPVNEASEAMIRARKARFSGQVGSSDSMRVELTPNKGIFKAQVCRKGACIRTKRIMKRYI